MNTVDHVAAVTFHGRKGAIRNGFRYTLDCVIVPMTGQAAMPTGFRRNRFCLWSVRDRDHGGAPGQGRGVEWVREVLSAHDLQGIDHIDLLTQPRVAGYTFNPVSFWLCYSGRGLLMAVIAEVSNTFGDRHSYLCTRADGKPIGPNDWLESRKIFHVSPFQPIGGGYRFRFEITREKVAIVIDYSHTEGGVVATLEGTRKPLTLPLLLWSLVRRPFGARRVMALILWQALRLKLRGAAYRTRPVPPATEVSR